MIGFGKTRARLEELSGIFRRIALQRAESPSSEATLSPAAGPSDQQVGIGTHLRAIAQRAGLVDLFVEIIGARNRLTLSPNLALARNSWVKVLIRTVALFSPSRSAEVKSLS
jgi:hypothetical protein